MPRSTVYGVLRRHGLNRLTHTDRTSGAVVRYQREHPGELVHLDVKKLGRIPDGGGHRIHGRAKGRRGRGIGYDYVHSAVDDRSRVAFSQLLPDETGQTCARFLVEAAGFFADHGVRIERVLTDNAKAYTDSVTFAETAARLGIRRNRTRRYRPQTNGKVERFNKTLLDEWAYARLYRSNTERRRAFSQWLRFYNHQRPHLARRPHPDGGPRHQRWWETHLAHSLQSAPSCSLTATSGWPGHRMAPCGCCTAWPRPADLAAAFSWAAAPPAMGGCGPWSSEMSTKTSSDPGGGGCRPGSRPSSTWPTRPAGASSTRSRRAPTIGPPSPSTLLDSSAGSPWPGVAPRQADSRGAARSGDLRLLERRPAGRLPGRPHAAPGAGWTPGRHRPGLRQARRHRHGRGRGQRQADRAHASAAVDPQQRTGTRRPCRAQRSGHAPTGASAR